MKHLTIIIGLLFFSLFATMQRAGAQRQDSAAAEQKDRPYPSVHYLAEPCARWRGDSLEVRFSGEVAGRRKGSESLHLIPIYISGGDTIRYPEVGYFTSSEAKYYKRREALSDTKTDGTVRVLDRKGHSEVDYRESMLVPQTFAGRVQLQQLLHTCCEEHLLASEAIAVPERAVTVPDTVYTTVAGMLPFPVAAVSVPLFETNVTFVRPKPEAVKERTATATVRITYPVNDWRVYPDFENHRQELSRIDKILSPVATDTATYRILSASITGYASPEDTYKHNMVLSEQRAGGMRDYLHGRYGLPTEKVTAEGKGEDWEGLREAVGRSDMKAKDEVLDIIDTYDIFDGREKLLMDLRGGDPYRYMLEHIFPPLRRMEMRIDYRVRAFDPEEAGELIGRRPQDLSLQEMYEVAQAENDDRTIVRQRDAYGREYDIAVRYFPDDDIANINASSAALVRGDLELAWVCLGRVRENPLAANNLGVYHWLCGKIGEAEAYFEKARATDPQRAAYNLEQLRKWKEEFGDEAEAGIDNVSE